MNKLWDDLKDNMKDQNSIKFKVRDNFSGIKPSPNHKMEDFDGT